METPGRSARPERARAAARLVSGISGLAALVLADGHFAYFDGLCHACSPASVPLVACAGGGRFRDCTSAHPAVAAEWERRYLRALREAAADEAAAARAHPDMLPAARETMRGAALGVYVCAMMTGGDAAALRTIRRIAPSSDLAAWLRRDRAAIRAWLASRGGLLLKT
jgi:hypothetical protein